MHTPSAKRNLVLGIAAASLTSITLGCGLEDVSSFTPCDTDAGNVYVVTSYAGGVPHVQKEVARGNDLDGCPDSATVCLAAANLSLADGSTVQKRFCSACSSNQLYCDGACVDVLGNSAHCGTCGHACPGECSLGECVIDCGEKPQCGDVCCGYNETCSEKQCVPDGDGDGVADKEDACPYNGAIQSCPSETSCDCSVLRKVDSINESGDKELVYEYHIYNTRNFLELQKTPEDSYQTLKIIIERDINLGDIPDSQGNAMTSCDSANSNLKIQHPDGISLNMIKHDSTKNIIIDTSDSKTLKTIYYEIAGNSCILPVPLFKLNISNEGFSISNLNLQYNSSARGLLFSELICVGSSNCGTIKNIQYHTKIATDSTDPVGGLIGTADAFWMQGSCLSTMIFQDIYADGIVIQANNSNIIGGLVGDALCVEVCSSSDLQKRFSVKNISGKIEFGDGESLTSYDNFGIGGVIGNASNSYFHDLQLDIKEQIRGVIVGGLTGHLNTNGSVTYNNIKILASSLVSQYTRYQFTSYHSAGSLIGMAKGNSARGGGPAEIILKNIDTSSVELRGTYIGGLIGTASFFNTITIQNVHSQIDNFILKDHNAGGLFGSLVFPSNTNAMTLDNASIFINSNTNNDYHSTIYSIFGDSAPSDNCNNCTDYSLSMHNVVAVSYIKDAKENHTLSPIAPDSAENVYYYSSNADAKAWPESSAEDDAAHRMTADDVDGILEKLNKDNADATWTTEKFCYTQDGKACDAAWPRVVAAKQKPQEGE